MLPDYALIQSLRDFCHSDSTILWLEGAKHERVLTVKLQGNRLILTLGNNISRVVMFDRYAITSVGLQFWSKNHAGVLYKWDQVPSQAWENNDFYNKLNNGDDPLPPAA